MLLKITPLKTINFQVKNLTLEMIEVSGGSFTMGENYEVTLSPYLIGKYPVTQALWSALMPQNPSHFIGKNRPVEHVAWFDALWFCNALNKELRYEEVYIFEGEEKVKINPEARGFRLPTEAQWEYAACGGIHHTDNYEYAGGNDLHNVGWYDKNTHAQIQPVGLKVPNQLGIYDMSGNVWEWCQDWYDTYPKGTYSNPDGPEVGSNRVFRGGSWYYDPQFCCIAYRLSTSPELRGDILGFRLAFAPPV